jgi:C4-dicarboxylate-specific signal transduction histidine kinase
MLGELSGALAHELNQPLTAILSNAQAAQQFLRRDGADLDEVQEILKDIVDEDKRASEVIRRLRVLLTKGHVQLQPLDLNELVQDVLKIMRADLLYNGVSVNTELAPELPVVNGDRVQLQQVLLNLMINGCDAMADTPKHERNLVVRTELVAGEGVRVSVADQGCGIPPNVRERVFEPFITTKKQGMGLGLAVCRTIIAAHGGKLWVENNPGRGATFTFSLKRKERGDEEALHTSNRQSVTGDQYGMINESNFVFGDSPSALKEDNRDNL